ncbi:unnamed protein product [Dovyalis caffra]|uniref:Uncharacterized protein n=1 Tax=Dovyalis caffra TaxID=77055 RepID=A0AAV1R3Y5_9ROSI|nr:unnamed protein product [Dovyalis caffra]
MSKEARKDPNRQFWQKEVERTSGGKEMNLGNRKSRPVPKEEKLVKAGFANLMRFNHDLKKKNTESTHDLKNMQLFEGDESTWILSTDHHLVATIFLTPTNKAEIHEKTSNQTVRNPSKQPSLPTITLPRPPHLADPASHLDASPTVRQLPFKYKKIKSTQLLANPRFSPMDELLTMVKGSGDHKKIEELIESPTKIIINYAN